MLDVANALGRIVTWFEEHPDQPNLNLAAPASADQIAAVEQTIGASLPDSVRTAYGFADGQDQQPSHTLFPDGYRWMRLAEMTQVWESMHGLFEGDDDEVFGKEWWHPGLMPLADNGSGDGLYVDLDGRNDGVVGEVIEFIHDDWPSQRTERTHPNSWATAADGFDAWLGRYADDLAAGTYTFRWGSPNTDV